MKVKFWSYNIIVNQLRWSKKIWVSFKFYIYFFILYLFLFILDLANDIILSKNQAQLDELLTVPAVEIIDVRSESCNTFDIYNKEIEIKRLVFCETEIKVIYTYFLWCENILKCSSLSIATHIILLNH